MLLITSLLTFLSITTILLLIKRINGISKVFNLDVMYLMFFLTFLPNLIGSTIILNGYAGTHYIARELNDNQINLLVWLICLILPTSIYLIIYFIFGNVKLKELSCSFRKKPVYKSEHQIKFLVFLLFLSFISLVSVVYMFRTLGGISLLNMFRLSNKEISISRYFAKFSFGGNVYIKNFFGIELSIILSYISFILYRLNKNKKYFFIWILNISLAFLSITYSYEKMPLAYFLVGYVLIDSYMGKLKTKRLLLYLTLIILVVFVITYFVFKYESVDYIFSINGPMGRVFIGQITPLYFHFLFFPDLHTFLRGMHYPKIIALLTGSEYVRSSKIVMDLYSKNIFAGHMNTLFIAEAYANWDGIGIFISIFMVSIVLGWFYYIGMRLKKTPISLGIFIYIYLELIKSINGGFYDFLYNPSLIFAIFIFLILQKIYLGDFKLLD